MVVGLPEQRRKNKTNLGLILKYTLEYSFTSIQWLYSEKPNKNVRRPRAIFTLVSSVIYVYSVGFALLLFVIGLKKNSRHFLNQSEVKPKPVTIKTKTNRDLLAQVFLRFV